MGSLHDTVTWYKNTLLDGKRSSEARKTLRLHYSKNLNILWPGLSLRGGGQGFAPASMNMAPDTFKGK